MGLPEEEKTGEKEGESNKGNGEEGERERG